MKDVKEETKFLSVQMREALLQNETDLAGVMERFMNNEELYVSCLYEFLGDPTMKETNDAIRDNRWDDAFTAAHGLKGMAGNMGFVPLFHSIGELVILIRSGRLNEIDDYIKIVNRRYEEIVYVIQSNIDSQRIKEAD